MPVQFNQHRTFYSTYGQQREFWPKTIKDRNPDVFYSLLMERGKYLVQGKQDMLRVIAEQAYYASGRPYYLIYPCILDLIARIPDTTTMRPIILPGVPDITKMGTPYLEKMAQTTPMPPRGLQEAVEAAKQQAKFGAQCIALRFPEGSDYLSILACFVSMGDSQLVGLHCNIRDPQNRNGHIIRDSCVNIAQDPTADDTIGSLLSDLDTQNSGDKRGNPERWYLGLRTLACLGMLVEQGAGFLERDLLARDAGKPATPEVIERAKKAKGLGWTIGAALEATPHMRRPHFAIRHTGPGRKVPLLRPIKGSVVKRQRLLSVPTGLEDREQK